MQFLNLGVKHSQITVSPTLDDGRPRGRAPTLLTQRGDDFDGRHQNALAVFVGSGEHVVGENGLDASDKGVDEAPGVVESAVVVEIATTPSTGVAPVTVSNYLGGATILTLLVVMVATGFSAAGMRSKAVKLIKENHRPGSHLVTETL